MEILDPTHNALLLHIARKARQFQQGLCMLAFSFDSRGLLPRHLASTASKPPSWNCISKDYLINTASKLSHKASKWKIISFCEKRIGKLVGVNVPVSRHRVCQQFPLLSFV